MSFVITIFLVILVGAFVYRLGKIALNHEKKKSLEPQRPVVRSIAAEEERQMLMQLNWGHPFDVRETIVSALKSVKKPNQTLFEWSIKKRETRLRWDNSTWHKYNREMPSDQIVEQWVISLKLTDVSDSTQATREGWIGLERTGPLYGNVRFSEFYLESDTIYIKSDRNLFVGTANSVSGKVYLSNRVTSAAKELTKEYIDEFPSKFLSQEDGGAV